MDTIKEDDVIVFYKTVQGVINQNSKPNLTSEMISIFIESAKKLCKQRLWKWVLFSKICPRNSKYSSNKSARKR
jgi:hypothetical protein